MTWADHTFFPGHAASIHLKIGGKEHVIGVFGILHPTVLDKYELRYVYSRLSSSRMPIKMLMLSQIPCEHVRDEHRSVPIARPFVYGGIDKSSKNTRVFAPQPFVIPCLTTLSVPCIPYYINPKPFVGHIPPLPHSLSISNLTLLSTPANSSPPSIPYPTPFSSKPLPLTILPHLQPLNHIPLLYTLNRSTPEVSSD